jgi:hypothetical protein
MQKDLGEEIAIIRLDADKKQNRYGSLKNQWTSYLIVWPCNSNMETFWFISEADLKKQLQ